MTAVLVVGDANVDLVLRGDVVPRFGQAEQLLTGADLVLGSSAGIVAAGLARLGVDVALSARVGDDVFGRRTRELLSGCGVDTAAVGVSGSPTGVSVILSAPDDRAILTLPGAMADLDADDVQHAVLQLAPAHVHVASFFLTPRLAPALPALLESFRARGVSTSLDTNWDPAERWQGVAACLPFVDVLLPNAAEAVALATALGLAPDDTVTAARSLAARGPIVAVKDGAAGGVAIADGEVLRAPGLAVDVVDTTGAGDSFDAGFLAAWLETGDVRTALRWGAVAGSLSTLGVGGTGAQPTLIALLDGLAAP